MRAHVGGFEGVVCNLRGSHATDGGRVQAAAMALEEAEERARDRLAAAQAKIDAAATEELQAH